MAIISVRGFFDTHVHTGPAPFPRLGDTVEVAGWCIEDGMAGFVVKSHFESTIAKAYHAQKKFPGLRVIPSITLNRGVGGLNPGAVEQSLAQGAKMVWLPTLDARNHLRYFGAHGAFGKVAGNSYELEKVSGPRGDYSVLQNGKLRSEVKEIIDIIVSFDAVLATGHIDKEEILSVVEYSSSKNLRRIVITHPEMYVPALDLRTQVELARVGCYMEYCAVNCMPMFHCVLPEKLKEMIEAVTPQRAILATDSGQPFSPRTPELFRIFAQMLYEKGVSLEAITQMAIKNPALILGLPPGTETVQLVENR